MPTPMLRDTQGTFGGGEVTPALYGRTDIQKYKTSAKTLRNMNVIPQGGARNRPGTAFVAMVGVGNSRVRLIPFIASTTQAYILELGQQYARFYTNDGQVQATGVSAWVTATSYSIGNFVTNGGNTYYCLIANVSSGSFAADLAAGDWIQQTAYQIVTPYSATDIFNLKFAQSADVMYFAHPGYAPQKLTLNSSSSWTMAPYNFIAGPLMPQNTIQANTITPSALAWITATQYFPGQYVSVGGSLLADLIDNFSSGNFNNWTISTPGIGGYFVRNGFLNIVSTPATSTPSVYQALSGSKGSFSATLGPGSSLYFSMSSNAVVAASGKPSGDGYVIENNGSGSMLLFKTHNGVTTNLLSASGYSTGSHFICIFRNAAGLFTMYVDGVVFGTTVTDTTYTSGSFIFLVSFSVANVAATFTNIYYDANTTTAQNTSASPLNYVCLLVHTSGTFATDLAAGDWALTTLITGSCTLSSISSQFFAGHVGSLWQLTNTLAAQTISDAGFTANTHASSPIQAGSTWSIITFGSWQGKILVQVSINNGATWSTVQTLQSTSTTTSQNYQDSGNTGYSQCLLRVSGDGVTTWGGTLTIDLTANSFDWNQIVQISSVTSPTSAVATIVTSLTQGTGLPTVTTFQWSEGSWSTYRGWPSCVGFYQDRNVWASTPNSEPNTVWHSETSNYTSFIVSQPSVASDSFSAVLSSRQLNSVIALEPMPQALLTLTGDTNFGLAPGSDGNYSATDIQQQIMDHRGSYNVDPIVVGNEIILIQQMGTVVRNLIYQLAVNGFMGDNISVSSQHLFTGFSIVQMAYQQEPDSIIWAIRSDGELLSCTYDRAQEMNAWTHHDTLNGLFESVACVPNPTLGINEIWFVVNRGGIRTVEVLKPRDQGTLPSAQWFVDCGTQYNGAPATVISGIPSFLNGTAVAVLADGNVVANGVNDGSPVLVNNGSITLSVAASVVTVGIPIVWDVGLLDIETPNPGGSLQAKRVKMPRVKVRCWNSRGGYVSTTLPAGASGLQDINGGSFDALGGVMQRDPSVNMDTALPLVTGIADSALPSGYQYGAAVCLRGIDPLPFTVLDIIPVVIPGGD